MDSNKSQLLVVCLRACCGSIGIMIILFREKDLSIEDIFAGVNQWVTLRVDLIIQSSVACYNSTMLSFCS